MINNKDDGPEADNGTPSDREFSRSGQQRRDPSFSDFVEPHDDGYEEPDRDTDIDSGYPTDSVEEEEFDDEFPDEVDDDPFIEEDAETLYDADPSDTEQEDAWLEKELGFEKEEETEHQNWPLGLIAVAFVALALLAAGGYGVMQQRAATEEELRELRAALATAASPEEVRTSRGALEVLQVSYDKLAAEAETLSLENRRLADTVAGLEAQLSAQQSTMTKSISAAKKPESPTPANDTTPDAPIQSATSSVEPAKPVTAEPAAPKPAPAKAASKPAATQTIAATSGPWFVNFGSYAMRNMADTWAARLHPSAGKVIIAPNTKDGKTLYRVRVVGLASRDSAKEVARKLEAEQRVSELWVGKE
ncbi:MAG: SPOR domain-containing protein [Halioglobus sp.]